MSSEGDDGIYLGVFGHVNIDWIVDASTSPPTEKGPFFGGVAGNVAVAAARFGVPVSLASFIGEDFPEEYLQTLRQLGVRTDHLKRVEGSTTSVCRLIYHADGRLDREMDHGPQNDDVRPDPEFVIEPRYVHVSTGFPGPCIWVAGQAHSAGSIVGFDPGSDLERYYDGTLLLSIMRYADIFFVNQEELKVAMDLLDIGSPSQFLDLVDTMVMTKGDAGSHIITREDEFEVPALGPKRIVDPTGAGDAYRAGLYAGFYRDFSLRDSCILGSIAASASLEGLGAQIGLGSWEDLLSRFEDISNV